MRDMEISESAVKLALDNAEHVERRPALQRDATAVSFNERGGLVMVPPNDPAVHAFIKELSTVEYQPCDNLRLARLRLRVATESYQARLGMRITSHVGDSPVFDRYVSLSNILIARAAGMHWHRVVNELEREAQAKRRKAWAGINSQQRSEGRALVRAIKQAIEARHD